MDRRVKERLVGASILVVLIVLIVPELLSGPALGPESPKLSLSTPEPTRNVTVDLTTSKAPTPDPEAAAASSAQASSAQAPIAQAQSSQAPQARSANAANTVATAAAHGVAPSESLETAAVPPTSVSTAAKSAIAARAWTVQLGSFERHDNADKLLRQLKGQGFSAFVTSSGSGASLRYRVRIGPVADRDAANQAVAKLKLSGHAASIVAPAP